MWFSNCFKQLMFLANLKLKYNERFRLNCLGVSEANVVRPKSQAPKLPSPTTCSAPTSAATKTKTKTVNRKKRSGNFFFGPGFGGGGIGVRRFSVPRSDENRTQKNRDLFFGGPLLHRQQLFNSQGQDRWRQWADATDLLRPPPTALNEIKIFFCSLVDDGDDDDDDDDGDDSIDVDDGDNNHDCKCGNWKAYHYYDDVLDDNDNYSNSTAEKLQLQWWPSGIPVRLRWRLQQQWLNWPSL